MNAFNMYEVCSTEGQRVVARFRNLPDARRYLARSAPLGELFIRDPQGRRVR